MDRARLGMDIRALREARRLKQRDVAEAAGVTFQYVSDVEKGEANVTIGVLEKIATAVGADIDVVVRSPEAANALDQALSQLPPDRAAYVAKFAELARRASPDLLDGIIVGLQARTA
jgi:transcriptional regulator with XRE-family HTH domain